MQCFVLVCDTILFFPPVSVIIGKDATSLHVVFMCDRQTTHPFLTYSTGLTVIVLTFHMPMHHKIERSV